MSYNIYYDFVDRRDCYNHERSITTGIADQIKNDYFKDFSVTAPHFNTIKKGGQNKKLNKACTVKQQQ